MALQAEEVIPQGKPARTVRGVVTSDKMLKTRTVVVPRTVRHRKYGKWLKQKTVYHVHDEYNRSGVGDTVEFTECRRLSKTKHWILVRIVAKGDVTRGKEPVSIMPERFLRTLDRLNREAKVFPPDETMVCTFELLKGLIARITLEPADGRLLIAEIPAAELADAGVNVGERFLLSPRSQPRVRRLQITPSLKDFEAASERIRRELEGLDI